MSGKEKEDFIARVKEAYSGEPESIDVLAILSRPEIIAKFDQVQPTMITREKVLAFREKVMENTSIDQETRELMEKALTGAAKRLPTTH